MKSNTISGTILVTLATFALLLTVCQAAYILPGACNPDDLEQIDSPKIRQICQILAKYADMMDSYSAADPRHMSPLGLMENGVKRQDVDHVFLRFGRRR